MSSVDPLARSSGDNYSRAFGTSHDNQPDPERERRARVRRQLHARDQHELRKARAAATIDRLLDRSHRHRQEHGDLRPFMPNEQLAQALAASGLTPQELAKKIGVEPATVRRWITTGRTPYPNHQNAVAQALDTDHTQLWPERDTEESAPAEPRHLNQRLRQAIFDAQLTPEKLAERLGLNPKTVERWITKGYVPYACNQAAAAVEIGVPEWELWPVPPQQTTPVGIPAETTPRDPSASRHPDAARSPLSDPARIRALMSWVDSTAPVKERDVRANPDQHTGPMVDTPAPTQHRAPRDPDFGRRGRSDGLEHTR